MKKKEKRDSMREREHAPGHSIWGRQFNKREVSIPVQSLVIRLGSPVGKRKVAAVPMCLVIVDSCCRILGASGLSKTSFIQPFLLPYMYCAGAAVEYLVVPSFQFFASGWLFLVPSAEYPFPARDASLTSFSQLQRKRTTDRSIILPLCRSSLTYIRQTLMPIHQRMEPPICFAIYQLQPSIVSQSSEFVRKSAIPNAIH